MKTGVCTIAAKNYLPQVRTLFESLAETNPDLEPYWLLVDRPEGLFDPSGEQFHVWPVEEYLRVDIPALEAFLFQYDLMEASTALKPFFLKALLQREHLDAVIYLDPDILVLADLGELLEILAKGSIALTPHILTPLPDDGRQPDDLTILLSGVFNLGFLGTSRSNSALSFLNWWANRLYSFGLNDQRRGIFVDQRWVDLVPYIFPGVAVIGDPGYNVAYWNLHERKDAVHRAEGRFLVGNRPLTFFHFSGFDPLQPREISPKFQTRFKWHQLNEDLRSLFESYAQKLLTNGFADSRTWPYAFAQYADGRTIAASERRAFWRIATNPFLGVRDRLVLESITDTHRPPLPGVNLSGYLTTESGVGEWARSEARLLKVSGLPLALNNIRQDGLRSQDSTLQGFATENPYFINIQHVNADQTLPVANALGPGYYQHRYNIAAWAWELSDFPVDRFGNSFAFYDEIWVLSRFVLDAIAAVSPVPVVRIPPVIAPAPPGSHDRNAFSLPDDSFVFLFSFDAASYVERKNPLAVIQAFQLAFARSPGAKVLLLIKSVNLEKQPEVMESLRSEARDPRIRFYDGYLDRGGMWDLIAAADCYVSLHRSEGFGLGMAEAMYLGKPVIATGYSGNLDFTQPGNSLLIPYTLRPLTESIGPYPAGALWADPDVDEAADAMRRLVEEPGLAARLGERAALTVREAFGAEAVWKLMKPRLDRALQKCSRSAGTDYRNRVF